MQQINKDSSDHQLLPDDTTLAGKRILLTRAKAHLPALDRAVQAHGGIAIHLPCLDIEYSPENINTIKAGHSHFSDIAFTSATGVHAVAECISLPHICQHKRVAAVGKKTADALQQYGVHVDITPQCASQDGLIAAYRAHGLPRSLLFFRAEQGRDALVDTLQSQNICVSMVMAYRTVCPQDDASDIIASMQANAIDAVLLGSAKTAAFYIQRIGSVTLANQPIIVVISESLAIAVRKMGLSVQVVAKHASFEAMLNDLAEYMQSPSSKSSSL